MQVRDRVRREGREVERRFVGPTSPPFLRHSVPPRASSIRSDAPVQTATLEEATSVRARPVVLLWRARPFSSPRSEPLLVACPRCSLPTFAFAPAFSFRVSLARVVFFSWCRASHRHIPDQSVFSRPTSRVPVPIAPLTRQTQKQTGFTPYSIQYTVHITPRVVPCPNLKSRSRCLSLAPARASCIYPYPLDGRNSY